jgi:HD-like signal output (HDOD) protein
MQQILDKLGQLPVLPQVAQQAIRSLNDPDIDAVKLANLIAQDVVLSARLLRIANSAFYGLSRQVATPHDAVMVMGLSQVRSLVMAASLAHALPSHAGGLDRKAHWRRGFRVASAAQSLARRARWQADAAFIAGMLHNLGELVLDVCQPETYARAREEVRDLGIPLAEAERRTFGFDHAEVGAEAARFWQMPADLEHAIRYCHAPEQAAAEPVSTCVAMACLLDDHLVQMGDLSALPELPEALKRSLPLDEAAVQACIPDIQVAEAAAEELLQA